MPGMPCAVRAPLAVCLLLSVEIGVNVNRITNQIFLTHSLHPFVPNLIEKLELWRNVAVLVCGYVNSSLNFIIGVPVSTQTRNSRKLIIEPKVREEPVHETEWRYQLVLIHWGSGMAGWRGEHSLIRTEFPGKIALYIEIVYPLKTGIESDFSLDIRYQSFILYLHFILKECHYGIN